MADRFGPAVSAALKRAGWQPGRRVTELVARWERELPAIEMFSAAQVVLEELGGLHVGSGGAGLECARTDIWFDPSLVADPDFLAKQSDRFGSVYPLGEAVEGHALVFIDKSGRILAKCNDGSIDLVGENIEDALERIVVGRRWSRP